MMTALLVRADLPLHATVTVDPEAVFDRRAFGASSVLGLQAGERISVEDLLYAMLLGSANDAAVALAIADDGSEAAFVRHMNARARRLGMTDTHVRVGERPRRRRVLDAARPVAVDAGGERGRDVADDHGDPVPPHPGTEGAGSR